MRLQQQGCVTFFYSPYSSLRMAQTTRYFSAIIFRLNFMQDYQRHGWSSEFDCQQHVYSLQKRTLLTYGNFLATFSCCCCRNDATKNFTANQMVRNVFGMFGLRVRSAFECGHNIVVATVFLMKMIPLLFLYVFSQ